MSRPLKLGIVEACTIILSKDITKMLGNSFLWIHQFDFFSSNQKNIEDDHLIKITNTVNSLKANMLRPDEFLSEYCNLTQFY